ncbi:hypothetical protein [Rhodococcoides fascians]|uniref:hypothetical protein n=1 Tax=Rhodococcoides fascians TaxID=1828 RepID=UPI00050BFFDD|nr:hypothetical protein [Rhodococcus fascians]
MWIVNWASVWTTLSCSIAAFPFSAFTADQFSSDPSGLRALWALLTVGLVAFGVYAAVARSKYDQREKAKQAAADALEEDAAKKAREASVDDPWRLENFVTYFETPVLQLASETFACWVQSIPRSDLRELRMEIMSAVVNSVGRSNLPGTRANVFEFKQGSSGTVELTNTEYFKGRGKRSVSKFAGSDPTFIETLSNRPRFVLNAGPGYEYETYMTMPIVAGPNDFYGALTVDAPKSGQLVEDQDKSVMRYWSTLLAITYALEGYAPVKGFCGEPD